VSRALAQARKPGPGYSPSYQADQSALGDMWVGCAARRASMAISQHNRHVWEYWFQAVPRAYTLTFPFAFHSAEM
jgi:carboxylesterase type B